MLCVVAVSSAALTSRERLLLLNKEYGSLIEEQKAKDAAIDAEVAFAQFH